MTVAVKAQKQAFTAFCYIQKGALTMNAFDSLLNYYSNYDENSRLTSRHGSVEFLTTLRYAEKYLKSGDKILEIGAGTGRYSHYFARKGYEVDAVELMPCNIEVFNANTEAGERIKITQGNATDLCFIPDNTYDVTLLLGPMYHLFTEDDQKAALQEAIRVTKQGGVIFVAYCMNDATVMQFCFLRQGLLNEHYKNLVDPETFKCHSNPEDIFVMMRTEEIDGLMQDLEVKRLHRVGTDMLTNYFRPQIDEMPDELFDEYLKYHFAICERADMVGNTNHLLDVLRKD